MKQVVFISHANPEDNYFASWLASKLKLLGYDAWVDINDLLAGDSAWYEIERMIRDNSARFLSVASKDYIKKARTPGSGIRKEISCAMTVKDIPGFIIPIRYDESDYADFSIDLLEYDAIDFHTNWADGLRELVDVLVKRNTVKITTEPNVIQFWFDSLKIKSNLIERDERHYTNWFPITLPPLIYLHQSPEVKPFPFTYVSDRALSFSSNDGLDHHGKPVTPCIFNVELFRHSNDIISEDGFIIKKPNNKLVQLLNETFRGYLIRRGLSVYSQSINKEVFYFPSSFLNRRQVNLKRLRKGRRAVVGKAGEFTWHFGISHSASLFPSACYKVFYHLIFSDKDEHLLNAEDQHALRRRVPSDWFNRKWFETLLAMMLKISDSTHENIMNIEVGVDSLMSVGVIPIDVVSKMGYIEPSDEPDANIPE